MKKKIRGILKKIYYKMPEQIIRLRISYVYNKDHFVEYVSTKVEEPSDIFTGIYKINMWHTEESVSGGGSTMEATRIIRKVLPEIIDKYSIKSMLDVPCGDFNWMKTVDLNCKYIGADIVSDIIENNQKLYRTDQIDFKHLDMTKDDLPQVDLIFCKDCLQHLSYEKVAAALNNFKRSGSKYLFVSSFPKTWRNHDIHDGDYRPLNLRKKPFCLAKPIFKIKEKTSVPVEGVESDKYMYLYKIESLPTFYNL